MKLVEFAKRGALKSVTQGAGNGWGGRAFWGNQSSSFDYNKQAGLRYDNSVVSAAIAYASNAMNEVDIYVRRPKGDGWEEVKDHPITQLLKAPNPWYDGVAMMSGWIISELAGRGGMSYTYKHRSSAGRLVGLEYIPHFAIRPFWTPGTGNFIDKFIMSLAGGLKDVPPKDILQQRYGPINPLMPQVCLGPLESVILEIATDKQAANYTAALLRNVGVTPHLISPNIKDDGSTEIVFGEAQIEELERTVAEKITGENIGRILIAPFPLKVDDLSFSPEDMNLEGIHNMSEERICAALRIPPLVLNLGTGLENTNNRASAEAAARQAARDFVKPYMKKKAAQLTEGLVPELGEEGEEVCFRIEHIEALQDDKTEKAKRNELACGGPWKKVNEVREEEGLEPIDGGDVLREKKQPEPMSPGQKQEEPHAEQSLTIVANIQQPPIVANIEQSPVILKRKIIRNGNGLITQIVDEPNI